METVFDALKAMGKATSIELAARLDISREEVLNELWELKKAGFVDKSAYTWRVADNNVQQEQPMQAGYCPTDCRFLQSYCVGKVIAGGAYGKSFYTGRA
ncbi:hypothetical protein FR987_005293 [Escherichia coli]|nr:hypothetical protein [Escherichia coli]EET8818888.1 hypothetical protein [Escherichia coli]